MAAIAVAVLPWSGQPHVVPAFTGPGWLGGWAQWDSGWYFRIATDGYSYVPGQQSTVVFFPAYPLLMRVTGGVVGDTYLAGILVTLAAGVGAVTLFAVWLRDRLTSAAAWSALLLFVLYPYSFFLFGAVYADAVFVAAAVGAFVLLERDHPWLAGLAAAVATAARPMGLILVVGLVLRALERRREPTERPTTGPAQLPVRTPACSSPWWAWAPSPCTCGRGSATRSPSSPGRRRGTSRRGRRRGSRCSSSRTSPTSAARCRGCPTWPTRC